MTGSDAKVKMTVASEPEEEAPMTSSSVSPNRSVAWLHLCIIYSLLGIYGLWAATSYQLMRTSLLDELEVSLQRGNQATAEELTDWEGDHPVHVDTVEVRRRRSADVLSLQDPAIETEETPVLSRITRDAGSAGRRRNERRRSRHRGQNRRNSGSSSPRRRQRELAKSIVWLCR